MAWHHAKLEQDWSHEACTSAVFFRHLWAEIFISLMDSTSDHTHRYTDKTTECAHPCYSGSLHKAQSIISQFILVAAIESPQEIKAVSGIFPGTSVRSTCQETLSFQPLFDFGSCLKKTWCSDEAVSIGFLFKKWGKKYEIFAREVQKYLTACVSLNFKPNDCNIPVWHISLINRKHLVTASAANILPPAAGRGGRLKFKKKKEALTLWSLAVSLSSSSNEAVW